MQGVEEVGDVSGEPDDAPELAADEEAALALGDRAHERAAALVRGTPDQATPTLVRVQVENPLSDLLHWRRDDFGVAATDALRAISAEGRGVMVVLSEPRNADALLARLRRISMAIGAVQGPFDCYLALRGLKTLHLRMRAHCHNAQVLAEFLQSHPAVDGVIWSDIDRSKMA